MKNKRRNYYLITGIILIAILGIIIIATAQTQDNAALQEELDNLIAELENEGYSWLINYSLAKPSIEVYRENSEEVIATFENILEENWYKVFLTSLEENESYDVFDLKIVNLDNLTFAFLEFDYIVDPIITISDVAIDATLINITAEVNFTHLNISTAAPYDSLNGYWPFDGDKNDTQSFTAYDFTKYNNDGNALGNAYVNSTGCIYGDCVKLDGNGDYVNFRNPSTINFVSTKQYTYTAWFKASEDETCSYDAIISDGLSGGPSTGWVAYPTPSGPNFAVSFTNPATGGTVSTTTSMSFSVWYHLALVYNSTQDWTIYINRNIEATQTTETYSTSTGNFTTGRWSSCYFNGSTDEIMVFNTSLTSAQISAIYNNQSSRFLASGKQAFSNQSKLNISQGYNQVQVTGDYEALKGSSINLSVGYYSGSWTYTAPQVYTGNNVFTISAQSTNLTLNFTFYAGNSTAPFYSPILSSVVNALTLNITLNTSVTSCGVLDAANAEYTQQANIIPLTSPCINITAQNITFNGNGFWIANSSLNGTGIYSNQLNTTIKNSNISMGSGVGGYGIELLNTNKSYIFNNTLNNQNIGLYLHGADIFNLIIENNTLNSNERAIYFDVGASDIYSNTTFKNNNIWNCTRATKGCIHFSFALNNTISGGIINLSSNNLVHLEYSEDNIFKDIQLYQASRNDTYLESSSTNNIFINVTYNISKESVASGSSLTRKWYYRAYVNDTSGNIVSNANVTAYNRTNSYNFNLTTDSTGYTGLGEIIDYVNIGGTRSYYSNYTIFAIKLGYADNNHSYNVTLQQSNYKDVFSLTDLPPNINFTSPTPSNASTQAGTSIFVNVTANDSLSNISTFIDFDNSLVGWWRMDDVNTSGDPTDYLGVNNGSKQGNAVQNSSGMLGKSFSFDGSGDYISIPTIIYTTNDNWTINLWSYAIENYRFMIIGKDAAYNYLAIYYDTDDIYFRNSSGAQASLDVGTTLDINRWNMISAQSNGSGVVRLFLDGSYKGDVNIVPSWSLDNIGSAYSAGADATYDFNGTIDDVMIFNRSLSAIEIQALYANTSTKYFGVNFTSLSEGAHTFKAYAQDTAGNVNSTETRQVTIDAIKPSITLNAPAANETITSSSVNFNWTATDNLDTSLTCNLTVDSVVNASDVASANGTATNYTVINFTDGLHLWNVTCWDNAPNVNTSATRNFTISLTSITSCQVLSQANTQYTQTANIVPTSSPCINITAQNVTFNCNSFWISNTTSSVVAIGIYSNQLNTTIKNCNVSIGSVGIAQSQIYLNTAHNSYIYNSTLRAPFSDGAWNGIYLINTNNTKIENVIESLNVAGITFASSSNNNITNSNISGNGDQDVNYESGTSLNNIFLNVSYSTETVVSGSSLTRKWYYRAYVNDTSGNDVSGANVTAVTVSVFNDYQFNLTTDSTGYTQLGEIIDYVNNGGIKDYYSLYNITAVNSSYFLNSHTYNATLQQSNYKDVFSLSFNGSITSCQVLNRANTIYTQQANIIPLTSPCINITAQNITFNGNGYWIANSTLNGTGIYSNQKNMTIRNANVSMGIGEGGYGIELSGADDSHVYNNTLNNQNTGLYSVNSDYSKIENNTANSNAYYGIYLSNSNNNNFTNNDIWNCSSSGSYSCVYLYDSDSNIFNINKINKSSNIGISLSTSDGGNSVHNIFKNTNMTNIDGTSVSLSAYPITGSTLNNTFLNFSYNNESVGAQSELIRKWYYRAYVNDTSGNNVSGANVTAYNRTGNYNFNLTTDSTGYTGLGEITDYVNNGGTRTYYSLYNIYASNSTYFTKNHTYNATLQQSNYKDVFSLSSTEVESCAVLNTANREYTQVVNIVQTANADCINITAQNITFNCNGYSITSSQNVSGVYSNQLNTTIKNCNIDMGVGSWPNIGIGIELAGANNSLIFNNTLNNQNRGLWLNYVYNTTIENNIANSNTEGIYSSSSSNNTIQNNIANLNSLRGIILDVDNFNNKIINNTANSNSEYGILLIYTTNNTQIINNTLNSNILGGIQLYDASNSILTNNNMWNCSTSNANSYGCLYVYLGSTNNTISGGIINKSAVNLIYIENAINNKFSDIELIDAVKNDTFLTRNSTNNIFLNVTYNISKEFVNDTSQLIRKWYYRAYVNDTSGNNISGANVTAYNRTNSYNFNLTTDSTGYTGLGEIIDYVNTGGTRSYYSLYNIYASNSSYFTKNHTYNATLQQSNYKDVFSLSSTEVESCAVLNRANTEYTLQNNIFYSSKSSCIDIQANNITFNLNGYRISEAPSDGSRNYAIISNGYNQTTIKNGKINNTADFHIYLNNSQGHTIDNITIDYVDITAAQEHGFLVESVTNSVIANITIRDLWYTPLHLKNVNNSEIKNAWLYNTRFDSVYLENSNNNTFRNITVNETSEGEAFYLTASSQNTFNDIKVDQSSPPGTTYGFYLTSSSSNNVLANMTIKNTDTDGIYIGNSNNTNISNTNISNSASSDINLYNSINNILLNVSYNISKETVASGSSLTRKWYYRAYVNDTSNNNMSGVNVTAFNVSNSYQLNLTTDSTGYTSLGEITDYVNTGGTRSYYSLHNIYAGNSSWPALNHTSNVTSQQNNYKDVFTFSQSTISLSQGWNMIGLTLHNTDTATNRNISLVAGWNLFGFSSSTPINISNINFTNSSSWSGSWSTVVSQGKAQAYFTYRQNNVYRYAATPDLSMHDTALRQNRSYWVRINQVGGGTLSMPSVGGSLAGQSYEWKNLRFSNGSLELNITEADNSTYDWVLGTGQAADILYRNATAQTWETVCGTLASCDSTVLYPWEKGYFMWVNQNNIQLIRRN